MQSNPRLSALVLLGLVLCAGARAEVRVGAPFPALESAAFTGGLPATAGKIVLVDFWASWCAPCRDSFPFFTRLQQDYGARGLVIVAVSVDEKAADFESFVKRFKPGFDTVRDHEQRLVREVKVPAMPTSYLIDRAGRLRSIHEGFRGKPTETALRKAIEALLAEKN